MAEDQINSEAPGGAQVDSQPSVVTINNIPIETSTPVPSNVGVGRPTVMTPEVLAKLEEAFSYGATDREATFVAGISNDALYDYCRENPDFASRKEALKDMPKYQARMNIAKAIKAKSIPVSQWYAERKIKNEFSAKTEIDLDANITGPAIVRLDE